MNIGFVESTQKMVVGNRPIVGLGVIIVKNNKVLLGKRKSSHGTGSWAFAGGHLEFGETFEQCAVRETAEETGLHITNVRFAGITNDIFVADHKQYITIFVLAEYVSGEPKVLEQEKCERWEWFAWNNLPQPLFLSIQNLLAQGFTL